MYNITSGGSNGGPRALKFTIYNKTRFYVEESNVQNASRRPHINESL